MLSRIKSLPKWVKITSIVGTSLILILIITMIVISANKDPFIGKWETDYEHYQGTADNKGIHLTLNSDGTFIFNKIKGTYATKNGLLTLRIGENDDDPLIYEYKITKNTLVLDGKSYFTKVKEFKKPVKDE